MKLIVIDKIDINYSKAFKGLPASRQEKVRKLCSKQDKIFATYEYYVIAKELNLAPGTDFSYMPNGKPFVQNAIDFSISNSSVLCIAFFDKNHIGGVDAEFVRKYDPTFAKMICNEGEIKQIEQSESKDIEFTKLFTKKEATLKAMDKNINNDLKNIIGPFSYTTTEKDIGDKKLIISTCEIKKSSK